MNSQVTLSILTSDWLLYCTHWSWRARLYIPLQPDHCSKHSSNEDIERKGWLILVNQHWLRNFFLLDSSRKDRCSAGSNESMELMLVSLFLFHFELCPPSQIGTSSLIFNAERCCKCQQMTLRCPSLVFVHSLFLSSLVSPHFSFYLCCSFLFLYLRLLLFLLYRASSSIAGQFFFFISTLHILFSSIWRASPFLQLIELEQSCTWPIILPLQARDFRA